MGDIKKQLKIQQEANKGGKSFKKGNTELDRAVRVVRAPKAEPETELSQKLKKQQEKEAVAEKAKEAPPETELQRAMRLRASKAT
jgi:hypothetical protein